MLSSQFALPCCDDDPASGKGHFFLPSANLTPINAEQPKVGDNYAEFRHLTDALYPTLAYSDMLGADGHIENFPRGP